jgi:transposase
MDITGAKRRTVQQWIARYNRGGIKELLDKPRSGRPALLSTRDEKRLARRIEAGPTGADKVSVFTGPAVVDLVEREFGVVYSLRGIERLLARLGFSYLAPRPCHEKADPQVQEEFKKTFQKRWGKSPSPILANE